MERTVDNNYKDSAFLQNFFSKNPDCDPNSTDFVGNYDASCDSELYKGISCSYASMVGASDTQPDCYSSPNSKYGQQIQKLQGCKSQLYSIYASETINNLKGDETLWMSVLQDQEQLFDASLNLLNATTTQKIKVENLVSSMVMIVLIIIIIYLLFSKIFV